MTFTQILAEARRLVKQNAISYTTDDIVTDANNALNEVLIKIRQSQGRWQHDDSNNTDFPFGKTPVTSDQVDYPLDQTVHYRIEHIEFRNSASAWSRLIPIDQSDIDTIGAFNTTSGTPKYYDIKDGSIFLYPAPNFTDGTPTNGSLKVFYERGPSYFTSSDTTKAPGFNPMFHELIPLKCSSKFGLINTLDNKEDIDKEIARLEEQLIDYYSLRNKDEHLTLTSKLAKFSFK